MGPVWNRCSGGALNRELSESPHPVTRRDELQSNGADQVFFDTVMVGNFALKSFARCAIFTATRRATSL